MKFFSTIGFLFIAQTLPSIVVCRSKCPEIEKYYHTNNISVRLILLVQKYPENWHNKVSTTMLTTINCFKGVSSVKFALLSANTGKRPIDYSQLRFFTANHLSPLHLDALLSKYANDSAISFANKQPCKSPKLNSCSSLTNTEVYLIIPIFTPDCKFINTRRIELPLLAAISLTDRRRQFNSEQLSYAQWAETDAISIWLLRLINSDRRRRRRAVGQTQPTTTAAGNITGRTNNSSTRGHTPHSSHTSDGRNAEDWQTSYPISSTKGNSAEHAESTIDSATTTSKETLVVLYWALAGGGAALALIVLLCAVCFSWCCIRKGHIPTAEEAPSRVLVYAGTLHEQSLSPIPNNKQQHSPGKEKPSNESPQSSMLQLAPSPPTTTDDDSRQQSSSIPMETVAITAELPEESEIVSNSQRSPATERNAETPKSITLSELPYTQTPVTKRSKSTRRDDKQTTS